MHRIVATAIKIVEKFGNAGYTSRELFELGQKLDEADRYAPSRFKEYGQMLVKSDLFEQDMRAGKPIYYVKKDKKTEPIVSEAKASVNRRVNVVEGEAGVVGDGLKFPDIKLYDVSEALKDSLRFSFSALNRRVKAVTRGIIRGLLVSGAPGIGKTFGLLEYLMAKTKPHQFFHLRGRVSPIMAYMKFYQYRHEGCVILVDDADGLMADDVGLNIIKAATEVDGDRTISWLTDRKMPKTDEQYVMDGVPQFDPETGEPEMVQTEEIPKTFKFEGSVILVSNIDFEDMKKGKNEEHVRAVTSRCETINMGCFDLESRFARVVQIMEDKNPLKAKGFTDAEAMEIMDFIASKKGSLKDVDLRTLTKVGNIYEMYREDDGSINPGWKKDAVWSLCKKEGDKRKKK